MTDLSSVNNENHQQNRKNQEQKLTGLKEGIEERRRQVYLLDLQGFSNLEIATTLQVSLSTVEKDLHFMKYYCVRWYHELFTYDIANPLLDSCNQIDIVQKELWKLFRSEENISIRKRILDSIVSNSIKKRDYFQGNGPSEMFPDKKITALGIELADEMKENSK